MGTPRISLPSTRDDGLIVDDCRDSPRVPLESEARIFPGSDTQISGYAYNLSERGVLVAVAPPLHLKEGDGARLRLRPPGFAEIAAYAHVRWKREHTAGAEPTGYGMEFHGLDRSQQTILAELVRSPKGFDRTPIWMNERYSVRTEDDRIWIRFAGSLEVDEARGLRAVIVSKLGQLSNRNVLAYFDASQARPCDAAALVELRRCLSALAERRSLCGLILARSPVAMMQLRRLAREVGVGDMLVCFEDEFEALRFWQNIATTPRSTGITAR